MKKYDLCIIGSGAGGGPVAYELSKAGYSVLVLEKGPWIKTEQFNKDEIVAARRSVYTPNLKDEQHVIESQNSKGEWIAKSTYETGRDFWSGNCVGGASNFMSGYFHRMKPKDFSLLSEYGPIKGANIVDWPIDYKEMEPYFAKVESVVGVSGKIVKHSDQEPRSTANFPYPPLAENIVSRWIDKASEEIGYEMVPVPRAILSRPKDGRGSCVYSNYCGSYGCSSDAKGSSRASLLNIAVERGNCDIVANAKVFYLETNGKEEIVKAHYYDKNDDKQFVEAKLFVVAAQAIETARLLLMSKNPEFPNGLANNNGLVGKNLIFSAGGIGSGHFHYDDFEEAEAAQLKLQGLFVNRSIHNWYEINDEASFPTKTKGGMVDFLFEHPNAIKKSIKLKWSKNKLVYGSELKSKMFDYFTKQRRLNFEIFCDWLPTDDCFVRLSEDVKDKWGDPVAHIRIGAHEHDLKVGEFLAEKSEDILRKMGAKNVKSGVSNAPPPNLVAGGCRFGDDPKISVLDRNCKAHEVDNLFVTDGSFMPTGGSVTYTWTIYANAFRVADKIKEKLRKES